MHTKKRMTLHVFNPEHDIALASGLENFTSPHAGRQLRHDLGFLPTLWAAQGDGVLVEDAEQALASLQRLAMAAKKTLGVTVGKETVLLTGRQTLPDIAAVSPWGWDAALRGRLRRMGIGNNLLPGDEKLQCVRNLSHRRTATVLLQRLKADGLATAVDDMPMECCSMDDVEAVLARYPHAVLKAPWSSSGRGVRFTGTRADSALEGWVRSVITRQGSVMAEPYYNKVKDFGMEFEAHADGSVGYSGLSLFHTANGAYTGNIVATEQRKLELIGWYLPAEFLEQVKERICHHLTDILQGRYQGPLGVDMMLVNGDCKTPHTGASSQAGFLLHPCVEVNLRLTMGHAALALSPDDDDRMGVMRITYSNGCYKAVITNVKQST